MKVKIKIIFKYNKSFDDMLLFLISVPSTQFLTSNGVVEH